MEQDPFEKIFEFTCHLCGIIYLKEVEWQAELLCGKCYQSEEDKFNLTYGGNRKVSESSNTGGLFRSDEGYIR